MSVRSMLLSEYYSTSCQSLSVCQRSKTDGYVFMNPPAPALPTSKLSFKPEIQNFFFFLNYNFTYRHQPNACGLLCWRSDVHCALSKLLCLVFVFFFVMSTPKISSPQGNGKNPKTAVISYLIYHPFWKAVIKPRGLALDLKMKTWSSATETFKWRTPANKIFEKPKVEWKISVKYVWKTWIPHFLD